MLSAVSWRVAVLSSRLMWSLSQDWGRKDVVIKWTARSVAISRNKCGILDQYQRYQLQHRFSLSTLRSAGIRTPSIYFQWWVYADFPKKISLFKRIPTSRFCNFIMKSRHFDHLKNLALTRPLFNYVLRMSKVFPWYLTKLTSLFLCDPTLGSDLKRLRT